MTNSIKVALAGRSEPSLKRMSAVLSELEELEISSTQLMVNGARDPLAGLDACPDLLVLHASAYVVEELGALAERREAERPALLVVGDDLPTEAVKFALRAGARDLLAESDVDELLASVQRLIDERRTVAVAEEGQLVAVLNAKGGSGATFIATSIAHAAAASAREETVVVDLDFQFGSLPHYLDLVPKRCLLEALANVHGLDGMALEAYVVRHSSGLRVMAPLPDKVTAVDFDVAERLTELLPVLRSRFRRVVVDVPRHVDAISSPVLLAADQIAVVFQQSLPSVRDAVRLKSTLVNQLDLPAERIEFVLNRHMRAGTIEMQDIREALGEDEIHLVPNQFKVVGQAVDMGVPVMELAEGSPVAKALLQLQARLMRSPLPEAAQHQRGVSPIERLKQWSPF